MLCCLVHFHTESHELLSHIKPVKKVFNDLKHLMLVHFFFCIRNVWFNTSQNMMRSQAQIKHFRN